VSSTQDQPEQGTRSGIQVIARAASILRALEAEPEGLSLPQIVARVGLAKSTTHRIILALQQERLLSPMSSSGKFRLGPALGRLGAIARGELRHIARPHIEDLARRVQETVDLAVLDGDHVLFVDQVPMFHRLGAVSAVGGILPAYCTASGKALLAAAGAGERPTLPRLERLTDTTITDPDAFAEELARIQREKVAYDREEQTQGICGVGAAVRSLDGELAAVGIPVPATRFYGQEQLLAGEVLTTARAIEADLASHFA
jgi:DNA-binding IclR family transcriptional regulator